MATFETLKQRLAELEHVHGITPVDILFLPEGLHVVVRKMLKHAMTPLELANELGLRVEDARQIGDLLVAKGYLQLEEPRAVQDAPSAEAGALRYSVRLTRLRRHDVPLDL